MARNKYPEETVNKILEVALKLFLEKGYEHTTVQDIVDGLGGLSKGAIYHHYKGKEDILDGVLERSYEESTREIYAIKNSKDGTALERLRKILALSIGNPKQKLVVGAAPSMMKNPRFLVAQLNSSVDEVAHKVLQPLVEQGLADGSICCDCPKEASEIAAILMNIWLNPLVFECSQQEFKNKFAYLKTLLEKMGLPIIDDYIYEEIKGYPNIK